MSEHVTVNLTQPKEEITVRLTANGENVVFSFSEAARGLPGSDADVTNANVNAAIDDDPAATRTSLELGSAALADTGAFAPALGADDNYVTDAQLTVIGNTSGTNTGDQDLSGYALTSDSRFTDARTPTAHASSHVTGGTDKIRDASASQDGLMTTAYASKLDGIEAGADVTDATNVAAAGAVMESDYTPAHSILVQQSGTGSPSSLQVGNNTLVGRLSGGGSDIDDLSASQVRTLLNVEDGADVTDAANVASTITGAAAKTTLVDADETVLTDSAASFGLKKVTWLNVYNYILTKLQAAASIVFTGQLRSTNQTAATADALMTRRLVDNDFILGSLSQINLRHLNTTIGGSMTNITANGAASRVGIIGNTTADAYAQANFNDYLGGDHGIGGTIATSNPFVTTLSFQGLMQQNTQFVFGVGMPATPPLASSNVLSANGVAFVIYYSTANARTEIKLVGFNNSTYVESSGLAFPITRFNQSQIIMEWLGNGTANLYFTTPSAPPFSRVSSTPSITLSVGAVGNFGNNAAIRYYLQNNTTPPSPAAVLSVREPRIQIGRSLAT
jgi:hypothetical protein